MSFSYLHNLNSSYNAPLNQSFKAGTNPAVQKTENPIDTIVKKVDEEKEKKHNKKAIAVTGSVIGISLLMAMFNPRYSTKLMEKLKASQLRVSDKIKTSKDSFIKSKFYNFILKMQNGFNKFFAYINNVNSVKDTYFKQLCTEESTFSGVRNGSKGFWQKTASVIRKVMKKPHETITRWGDDLAKFTVKMKYKKAASKMDHIEKLLSEYGNRLPADKRALFESKLQELKANREFFDEANLLERFKEQEKLMENIDRDVRNCFDKYIKGFGNQFVNKREHFIKNYSFWAGDIMQPAKDRVNKAGTQAVDAICGNKEGVKGTYNELIDILSTELSSEEIKLLKNTAEKTEKSLRSANFSECSEYFDKKRDLILGSAPTDIVTAAALLGGSGIALASAGNKDERISETITNTVPIVAGVGTNTILTSMLVAGPKGLIISGIIGGIISLIGSGTDHIRLNAKAKRLAAQEKAKEAQNV